MLSLDDLNYIYNLIERANITGSEVDKVVKLKMKIINILKEASEAILKQQEAQKAAEENSKPEVVPASDEASQPSTTESLQEEVTPTETV